EPSSVVLTRVGASPETQIKVSFDAVLSELSSPLAGANEYLLYLTSSSPAGTPADPCVSGTLAATLGANYTGSTPISPGDPLEVTITNLRPRTRYQVCIKTRDTPNNYSIDGATSNVIATGDTTAPTFNGIQALAYNPVGGSGPEYEVSFMASSNADTRNYVVFVKIVRNSVHHSTPQYTYAHTAGTAGTLSTVSFTIAAASVLAHDEIT